MVHLELCSTHCHLVVFQLELYTTHWHLVRFQLELCRNHWHLVVFKLEFCRNHWHLVHQETKGFISHCGITTLKSFIRHGTLNKAEYLGIIQTFQFHSFQHNSSGSMASASYHSKYHSNIECCHCETMTAFLTPSLTGRLTTRLVDDYWYRTDPGSIHRVNQLSYEIKKF